MRVDPAEYEQIPENPHRILAGSLLLPTSIPIVVGGGTSMDFVREQGGTEDTFIFMFGVRPVMNLLGMREDILEGVFLSEDGPGFVATWNFHQLMRETDLGGWKVIPTDEVIERWAEKVERRMNKGWE